MLIGVLKLLFWLLMFDRVNRMSINNARYSDMRLNHCGRAFSFEMRNKRNSFANGKHIFRCKNSRGWPAISIFYLETYNDMFALRSFSYKYQLLLNL